MIDWHAHYAEESVPQARSFFDEMARNLLSHRMSFRLSHSTSSPWHAQSGEQRISFFLFRISKFVWGHS